MEVSGPKANTVARGHMTQLLEQAHKMGFFLKPHQLEQNSKWNTSPHSIVRC